jgi:hypothetical protein
MMTINRFLGRSVQLRSGLSVGFNWVHGNGQSSKTSAVLASYHPPSSLTWGWALYWMRPRSVQVLPKVERWTPRPGSGYGSCTVTLPFIGGFSVSWQPLMRCR